MKNLNLKHQRSSHDNRPLFHPNKQTITRNEKKKTISTRLSKETVYPLLFSRTSRYRFRITSPLFASVHLEINMFSLIVPGRPIGERNLEREREGYKPSEKSLLQGVTDRKQSKAFGNVCDPQPGHLSMPFGKTRTACTENSGTLFHQRVVRNYSYPWGIGREGGGN